MGCTCPAYRNTNVRVTLLRFDSSTPETDHGESGRSKLSNYTSIGTRFCSVKSGPGSERLASDQPQGGNSFRVFMRRDSLTRTLTRNDRLQLDGHSSDASIDNVYDENEERKWIVANCTESA